MILALSSRLHIIDNIIKGSEGWIPQGNLFSYAKDPTNEFV
jgi:hypothetical protein